jgi:NlpE N-terminal domain
MKLLLIFFLIFPMLFIACQNDNKDRKSENKTDTHSLSNDKNFPHWVGIYKGNIPTTTNNTGIETTITLKNNNTYTEHLEYDFLESRRYKDYEGTIEWQDDSTKIKLVAKSKNRNPQYLKFEKDNLIIQLSDGKDREHYKGLANDAILDAEDYTLKKTH